MPELFRRDRYYVTYDEHKVMVFNNLPDALVEGLVSDGLVYTYGRLTGGILKLRTEMEVRM